MRTLFRSSILIVSLLVFAPGLQAAQCPESGEFTHLSIEPGDIQINAFYRGTDVEVRAELPVGCDGAVVKIQGNDGQISLNKKGKVYLFWLNVGGITIANAPDIYIVNSSAPLDSICTVEAQQALLLGYDALKEHVEILGKNSLTGSEFSDFIKLKEHNGSYQQTATAQLIPSADNTSGSFKASLHIPPVMPSGNYRIHFYCFRNRTLAGESCATLNVEKVGLPKYLHSLAFNHPAIYGVFACVIAMATGIIMSLIFGSRRKR